MTPTEELRAMLDERGVEWTEGVARPELTLVRLDGNIVKFHPWQPNTLKVSMFNLTPEQAIAATLGAGTCRPIISDNLAESEGTGDAWADCSECGHLLFVLTDPTSEPPNFCPNCGRRVMEVDG